MERDVEWSMRMSTTSESPALYMDFGVGVGGEGNVGEMIFGSESFSGDGESSAKWRYRRIRSSGILEL